MGFSTEDWKKFSILKDGVEIRDNGIGEGDTLLVDGCEVWTDSPEAHPPEDILLSRDLSAFVYALRDLAAERTTLREERDRLAAELEKR